MMIYYMTASGTICGIMWYCTFSPFTRRKFIKSFLLGIVASIMGGCLGMGYALSSGGIS